MVGVAGIVGASAAFVAVVHRHSPEQTSSRIERIPDSGDTRWNVPVRGAVAAAVAADDSVVVATTGLTPAIMALRSDTGAVRWSVDSQLTGSVRLAVIDDAVVFVGTRAGLEDVVGGIDLATGRSLWRRSFGSPTMFVVLTDRRIVVSRLADDGRRLVGLDLLGPRTGADLATLRGDDVRWNDDAVQIRRGDSMELYDGDTFDRTATVDVRSLGDEPVWLVAVSVGFVALGTDRTSLLDPRGDLLESLSQTAEPASAGDTPTGFASGDLVVAQMSNRTIGYRTGNRLLVEAWSKPGRVLDREPHRASQVVGDDSSHRWEQRCQ